MTNATKAQMTTELEQLRAELEQARAELKARNRDAALTGMFRFRRDDDGNVIQYQKNGNPLQVQGFLTLSYKDMDDQRADLPGNLSIMSVTFKGDIAEEILALDEPLRAPKQWAILNISGELRGWGGTRSKGERYLEWQRVCLAAKHVTVVSTNFGDDAVDEDEMPF